MAHVIQQLSGLYGTYYSGVGWVNDAQQKRNAVYIRDFLINRGWHINSIAAALGNMENESGINPGMWEQSRIDLPCYLTYPWGVSDMGGGLVGWTPGCTRLLAWAADLGVDWQTMDWQCNELDNEMTNNRDHDGASVFFRRYSDARMGTVPMTSNQFKTNSGGWSPEQLAINFVWYYESPFWQSDGDIYNHNFNRSTAARKWLTYLGGSDPGPWTSRKRMKPWMMIGLVNPDNL